MIFQVLLYLLNRELAPPEHCRALLSRRGVPVDILYLRLLVDLLESLVLLLGREARVSLPLRYKLLREDGVEIRAL